MYTMCKKMYTGGTKMSKQLLAPTTDAKICTDNIDVDLSRSPGPVTITVDGVLGAAEEFVFNTINSDNTCLPVAEDTEIKKLTLANTVITTYSKETFRITKTATALAVGLRISRGGR
jgi:hypothetical protein